MSLPTVITTAGLQPQTPADLRAQLLALAAAASPGYTANLPGSLIEDISSTDVGAMVLIDQARVEAVNSLTPYAANAFLLQQLGQIYLGQGSAPAVPSNTSVYVVFSGPAGYAVPVGFTVSDGLYQYVVQSAGIIGAGGDSDPIFCQATVSGSWAVPSNSVTQLITSVPTGIALSCTNPQPGIPGGEAETEEEYRARVLTAGQAIAQGMITELKTALSEVSGVPRRLISVRQQPGGWQVLVGGGDQYQVANAIFLALFDISSLVGSTLRVTNITQANPGQVTTDLNHGYETGQAIQMSQIVGMTPLNGVDIPSITVVDEKNFTIGIDTRPFPAYISGGVVSPNLRNASVDINDYPDIYSVLFVRPPQQSVVVDLTWNTSESNFVSASAVAQLGNPALVNYINSIPVGAPINLFEAQTVFQAAIASVLDPNLLTRMVWAISINGVPTEPTAGTGIVQGDPESYFLTTTAQVVITQG